MSMVSASIKLFDADAEKMDAFIVNDSQSHFSEYNEHRYCDEATVI